jgi:hypothetical protein
MKNITKLLILITIFVIGLLGFFAGKKIGTEKTERKLFTLINRAYPRPPEFLTSTSGTVKNVSGATITLEIIDPEDYLPHLDNSPYKKIKKFVSVNKETEIIKKDFTNLNQEGEPSVTNPKIEDIKTGDQIIIYTNENIRENNKITATQIKIVKS